MEGGMTMDDLMTDGELLDRVRAGDGEAYGVLFARHRRVADRVAARVAARGEEHEVVAEAFVSVLAQIRAGRGPTASFRAYLLTTVRHEAVRRRPVARRCEPVGDMATIRAAELPADVEAHELVSQAYDTLPDRWRDVLWHLEVEGLKPHELTERLGLSANAVAALGYRARAGLRAAYRREVVARPDAA